MINKRIAALVIAGVVFCTAHPVARAAPSYGETIAPNSIAITPFWTNVSRINLSISFSGTTATCSGKIIGLSGTTKIKATFVLERKNSNGTYTTVKTFPEQTANSATLNFSDTATITTGHTYRLSVTATVTRNGVNETVSSWVEKAA